MYRHIKITHPENDLLRKQNKYDKPIKSDKVIIWRGNTECTHLRAAEEFLKGISLNSLSSYWYGRLALEAGSHFIKKSYECRLEWVYVTIRHIADAMPLSKYSRERSTQINYLFNSLIIRRCYFFIRLRSQVMVLVNDVWTKHNWRGALINLDHTYDGIDFCVF